MKTPDSHKAPQTQAHGLAAFIAKSFGFPLQISTGIKKRGAAGWKQSSKR